MTRSQMMDLAAHYEPKEFSDEFWNLVVEYYEKNESFIQAIDEEEYLQFLTITQKNIEQVAYDLTEIKNEVIDHGEYELTKEDIEQIEEDRRDHEWFDEHGYTPRH